MAKLRFAVLVTSTSRYATLIIGLCVTMALSRLLTPADIGTILIGTNLTLFVAVIRDFVSPLHLVQKAELSDGDISALAMAQVALAFVIGLILNGMAHVTAVYFQHPVLESFLRIAAIALLAEALTLPGQAVLQRQMRFGALATVVLAQAIVQGALAVGLALAGFGVLASAWGWVGGAFAGCIAAFVLLPPRWLARPSIAGLGQAFAFGRYQGISGVIYRAYTALTSAAVGRSLSLSDAGYFGRATNLSQLSDRLFVDIVVAVAVPSFSHHVRTTGEALTRPYLKWLEMIAAIHWPGLVLLILFAEPIVYVLYGSQWLAVVPLIQFIAAASFFATPTYLAWPALMAAGGMRDRTISIAITFPLAALIFCIATQFGLTATALSFAVFMPINALIELHFVRRRIPLSWPDLAVALRRPLMITLATAVGPLAVQLIGDVHIASSLQAAVLAAIAATAGWLLSIVLTRHPLKSELKTMLRLSLNKMGYMRSIPDAPGT